MYLQYECKKPVSLAPALKLYNQPAIGAEWLFLGTGIGASNQFEAGGFIRSDAEFDWPNLQYHFLPVAINYNGSNPIKAHSFQMHVGSMRSPSRGRIHVRSKDPREHPSILFNYMSHEQDWREFRAAIRITREIFAQPALAPYSGREISPAVHCRPTRRSMHSCASMPKPPTTRRARTRWAMLMTRWRWSMARVACTAWKASASSMPRSCRRW